MLSIIVLLSSILHVTGNSRDLQICKQTEADNSLNYFTLAHKSQQNGTVFLKDVKNFEFFFNDLI